MKPGRREGVAPPSPGPWDGPGAARTPPHFPTPHTALHPLRHTIVTGTRDKVPKIQLSPYIFANPSKIQAKLRKLTQIHFSQIILGHSENVSDNFHCPETAPRALVTPLAVQKVSPGLGATPVPVLGRMTVSFLRESAYLSTFTHFVRIFCKFSQIMDILVRSTNPFEVIPRLV